MLKAKAGISSNALKMIALASMFLDHVGYALIQKGLLDPLATGRTKAFLASPPGQWLAGLSFGLRVAGRLAFPIFCFLLVEGFAHTRSVKKYGARLLAFALVSEVPFDLAFHRTWFYPGDQNIYFTLVLGLLAMAAMEGFRRLPALGWTMAAICCGAAYLLQVDYGPFGVALILVLYLLRQDKLSQALYGGVMAAIISAGKFGAGALAFIPIWLYGGRRGKAGLKYFFYWFYPVHLAFLCLLRVVLFSKI